MSEIEFTEHWAKKGAVDLCLYRKRQRGAGTDAPVLVLVHGSSVSARTGYDLQVPGHSGYSMMDHFAARGFDVWALDHEGYGKSSHTDAFATIAEGADDLAAAAPLLAAETGRESWAFFGASAGGLRAGAFANAHPERISALAFDGFTYIGADSPTLIKRAEKLDEFRASNRRPISREFMLSIFARDGQELTEPGVAEAFADTELAYHDSVPTGTYIDMCANMPVVDPTLIRCPVLITRSEHDGNATLADLLAFFAALPEDLDKQFVILPGQAHASLVEVNRRRMWHVVAAFLETPARRDVAHTAAAAQ